jgi:hypothetical protein
MLSFFYPENILFGEKLWESPRGAIYKRSSVPLPGHSLSTKEFGKAGMIFASYQNLGSIDIPFVFANHSFRKDDRDRGGLYDFDVVSLMEAMVCWLDPETSAILLESMKDKWHDYPKKKYDFKSFYSIISTLARNVSSSCAVAEKFRKAHPSLLPAAQVDKKDIVATNRRKQALAWKSRSLVNYRLVQISFVKLGYPTLEEECEKSGGFSLVKEPDATQRKYISVIEAFVEETLGASFFGLEKLPKCSIIISEESAWAGMATCFPVNAERWNRTGRKIKFSMNTVAIMSKHLAKGRFANAVGIYVHELCHVFGKDKSSKFSNALTDAMEILISSLAALIKANIAWNAAESDPAEEAKILELFD